jgi:DNA-binding NtrC family response regulator
MVVMAGSTRVLGVADLPPSLQRPPVGQRLASLPLVGYGLEELERQAICQTLDQFDGNRTRAAQCLGVSVRTLHRKLEQWRTRSFAASL